MEKAARGKFDSYLALLNYRNTQTELVYSPVQRHTQSASAVKETVRALNTPHTGCATEAD